MFDGTAKLASKDFDVKSNQSPALTGKGGKVSDLKASDPDIKTSPIPELSLSGTKLSGETPGQAATKQSSSLLASAMAAISPQKVSAAGKITPFVWQIKCPNRCPCRALDGITLIYARYRSDITDANEIKKACDTGCNILCEGLPIECSPGQVPIAAGTCGPSKWTKFKDWWHSLWGEKPCGSGYYKAKTECCSGEAAFPKQTCTADLIKIGEPSADLILGKPPTYSPPITLRVTASCCPGSFKWSSSSNKIKFIGPTDQAAAQIVPIAESEKNSDVSVTVTVAGGASATKKLTVRRPKFLSHPPLQLKISRNFITRKYDIGTRGKFKWTLTDQPPTASYPSGRPLANVEVTEIVTFDLSKPHTINPEDANWPAVGFIKITQTTNAAGQINDQYAISTDIAPARIEVHLNQKLIVVGYSGMSDITITDEQVTGKTPVELQ